ncbi:MAG: hypothetical protein CMO32_34170 [Variovorax sp.]|nr:hypothetical protein [Variovorax sp.]
MVHTVVKYSLDFLQTFENFVEVRSFGGGLLHSLQEKAHTLLLSVPRRLCGPILGLIVGSDTQELVDARRLSFFLGIQVPSKSAIDRVGELVIDHHPPAVGGEVGSQRSRGFSLEFGSGSLA